MGSEIPELWIVASVAAAGFQTLRFVMQKVLSAATLSPTGATFARFVYSAPIVFVGVIAYLYANSTELPALGLVFWAYAVTGGVAQVLATICVVSLFKTRNFAVGVTLMKTETILAALVGMIVLGDKVTVVGFLAISIGLIGVLMLSKQPSIAGATGNVLWNKSIILGLTSGVLFAVSAVSYRGASLEILSTDPVLRAGVTLSAVTALQMFGMAVWLRIRDAGQITAVWRARHRAIWIGLLSLAGSFCWFFAFTLQNAAYVKAVGQVELIFSLAASVFIFSERSSARELIGMAVLTISILLLIFVIPRA